MCSLLKFNPRHPMGFSRSDFWAVRSKPQQPKSTDQWLKFILFVELCTHHNEIATCPSNQKNPVPLHLSQTQPLETTGFPSRNWPILGFSQACNNSVSGLWCLASFMAPDVFKVQLCWNRSQYFSPFDGWTVFYCVPLFVNGHFCAISTFLLWNLMLWTHCELVYNWVFV